MLAIEAMSAGVQATFYGLACLAFLVAVIYAAVVSKTVDLIAIGLTLFSFVFFYNALAAT
jgi:hypothetical protein